jgi:hypothetical protein
MMLGAPASSSAALSGQFAVFAQCPIGAEGLSGCLYGSVEGGYLTLGRTVVPIAKALVLQGGFLRETEAGEKQLVAARDGETLTKARQTLPGGLFGSPLYAVAELAAPASSVWLRGGVFGEGLALRLPIKIRLVNPLLGAECSIGSNSHPIELNVTTGAANDGLTGNPGTTTSIGQGEILLLSGVSMVSSGFAVPKAGGCGSTVVDEALDAKLGLPSTGNTSVVFDMKIEMVSHFAVEEEEA